MVYLTGIYFFALSAVNLADISSTCNSRRFTISALESFRQTLSRKNFPQKNCRAKLAAVKNQSVARPPPPSSGQTKFLLNQLKVSKVTDLIEIFKSGTLSRKISISERLGSGMHLRNGNEQKCEKIKTFPNKMNAPVFILS